MRDGEPHQRRNFSRNALRPAVECTLEPRPPGGAAGTGDGTSGKWNLGG